MSSCPFLNRVSINVIKTNYGKILQRMQECPVMRTVTRSYNSDVSRGASAPHPDPTALKSNPNEAIRKCPFLSRKFDSKIDSMDSKQSSELSSIIQEHAEPKTQRPKPFHPLLERAIKGNSDLKGSEDCLFECGHSTETDSQFCGICGTSVNQVKSAVESKSEKHKEVDPPSDETPGTDSPIKSAKKGLFDYSQVFDSLLEAKRQDHSYRIFKKIERKGREFPKAREHTGIPKDVTVWCSNDYMGMSWHPYVMAAAKSTIDAQGTGSGGTRNISGNLLLHEKLESTMAEHHDKEAALIFTSCYVANQWALNSLGKFLPGCVMVSDENNHASMIEGIRSSGAKKMIYKHNSLEDLESKLKTITPGTPTVVAFESVHSMTGTMSPIADICDLAHSYGALTYLDEVHAVGLYGKTGAGAAEEFGCADKVDILTGTFGKAFGNIGGYVASSANLIDFLRSFSSGFIFTTSLPPAVIAGALTAVQVLAGDEGRHLRERQRAIVRSVRTRLQAVGIPAAECPTHIIPVHVGDADLCLRISNELLTTHKIYVQSINYPTVPRGQECLRIAPTPHHTDDDIDVLVAALTKLWATFGGPYLPNAEAAA